MRRIEFLWLWCSEYLVKNKIAAAGKVAINGASNGGKQLRYSFDNDALTTVPQASWLVLASTLPRKVRLGLQSRKWG